MKRFSLVLMLASLPVTFILMTQAMGVELGRSQTVSTRAAPTMELVRAEPTQPVPPLISPERRCRSLQ